MMDRIKAVRDFDKNNGKNMLKGFVKYHKHSWKMRYVFPVFSRWIFGNQG